MKKINLLLLPFIGLTTFSSGLAQEVEWAFSQGDAIYNVAGKTAIDHNDGSIYLTGFAGINDFDPGPGVYSPSGYGISDIYLQKLDSDGNFLWAQWIGGSESDYAYNVTVGNDGSVYVTGSCGDGADLNPGAGTYIVNSLEPKTSFIAKYAPDGTFIWASAPTFIDGQSIASEITVDDNNNVYVGGYYSNTAQFTTVNGVVTLNSAGSTDAYLWKLDEDGNTQWVKSYGGTDGEEAGGLDTDSEGNIYYVGRFSGTADFNPEAGFLNLISNGQIDGFIIKVNPSGSTIWAESFGSGGIDYPQDVRMDNNNKILLFGIFTNSFDADFGTGTNTLTSSGNTDFFIIKTDSAANHIWSYGFGGTMSGEAHSVAIDNANSIYLAGGYIGLTDLDPSVNIYNLPGLNHLEPFLVKLNSNGEFEFAKSFPSLGADRFEDIEVADNGNFYALGLFNETLHYNDGLDSLISLGSSDVFMMKFSQIDGGISQDGLTLSSESTFAENYQWYDCNLNQIIPGETNPDFDVTENGSFAVIVSNGNSIDTSDCIVISTLSQSEISAERFAVFPNPASSKIVVVGTGKIESCVIMDLNGKTLLEADNHEIDISHLANGTYLLRILSENKIYTHKIIKQ